MHRLRFLRVPFGGGAGAIRPRPTPSLPPASVGNTRHVVAYSSSMAHTSRLEVDGNNSSSRCLSTSTNKRYQDIPKRIYQGAPKRGHGKYSGMKKWSRSRAAPGPGPEDRREEEKGRETQVALAKVDDGSGEAAENSREVSTRLKEIRVSPWSLNLVAKLVRGLPVVDANAQLMFCKKKHTISVAKAIQNALNLADMRYGLAAEDMEVAEVFVTKGRMMKKIRIMGRGRVGISRRKWSHLNLTLREINFDKQIREAPSRYRREKLQARKQEVLQRREDQTEQVYADPV